MNTDFAPLTNPFALMVEPDRVLHAMEQSRDLRTLRRRTLHPLDKPLIPYTKEALERLAAIDAAIDAEVDAEVDAALDAATLDLPIPTHAAPDGFN